MIRQIKNNDLITGTVFFFMLFLFFSFSFSGNNCSVQGLNGKSSLKHEISLTADNSKDAIVPEIQSTVHDILHSVKPVVDRIPESLEKYLLTGYNNLTACRISFCDKIRQRAINLACWKQFYLLSSLHGDELPSSC